MRSVCLATCAVFCLALPIFAQDQAAPNQPNPGRVRRGGPQGGFQPGAMLDRVSRRLTDDLALDEQQQAQLKDIVAQFQKRPPSGPGMMNDLLDQVETILDEGQVKKLSTFREQMARFAPGGQGPGGMFRMMQDLPDRLQLDDQQKAQYDELVNQLREQGRQHRQEMGPLMEEMRQARDAGDDQRVAEIRQQLQQARGGAGNPMQAFFDDLDKILRDDQKATLADIRQEFQRGGARSQPTDVRSVLQAVKRLELDSEQRDQVRNLEQRAMRATRDVQAGDQEAQAKLARDVRQQIVKVLRPDQVQQFEQILQGNRPQRNRPNRADRAAPLPGDSQVKPPSEQEP